MPVVPPAAQSDKAQIDAADIDAHAPATQDGAASASSGTPAAPSPERAVIPTDAKAEKDAVKPLYELAKVHPDVHPHTADDDDDLDSKDAVSEQSPVDSKPAPAADGAERAPAADGVEKPPAADGVEKPPASDSAKDPPVTDGAPAAGAEAAPKEGAKEADKFNDQGLEEPTAPPPGITQGPDPPSDPKPPSKPKPDAPPPTTQEIQDALDRIYANANKDDGDRQRLANGHDTELQIPYRALGIALLVFVAFFLGVRWKRRPRYGGYAPVPLVEVREEQPVVKPRHYRD